MTSRAFQRATPDAGARGHHPAFEASGGVEAAREVLAAQPIGFVLCDVDVPGGLRHRADSLRGRRDPGTAIVMLTGVEASPRWPTKRLPSARTGSWSSRSVAEQRGRRILVATSLRHREASSWPAGSTSKSSRAARSSAAPQRCARSARSSSKATQATSTRMRADVISSSGHPRAPSAARRPARPESRPLLHRAGAPGRSRAVDRGRDLPGRDAARCRQDRNPRFDPTEAGAAQRAGA